MRDKSPPFVSKMGRKSTVMSVRSVSARISLYTVARVAPDNALACIAVPLSLPLSCNHNG